MPRKNLAQRSLQNIIEGMGGREEMLAVLEVSDDPVAEKLLGYLTSPTYDNHSVRSLCKRVGITVGELQQIYANTMKAKALMAAARHLPRVVEDTFIDSLSRTSLCPTCYGEKTIYRRKKEVPCATCDGEGRIRVQGDVASRKLALTVVGLVKQGPLMEQNLNFDKAILVGGRDMAPLEAVVKEVNMVLRKTKESPEPEDKS